MSFLGKANFCTNGHSHLRCLCCVIQSDILCVYHSPTQLFSCVHFPFPPYINWNSWLICNRAWFLCNFHFLMWLLLLMLHPLIGPFIFRDLGYLYGLVVPGQVLCVGLILPCRSFRQLPWCYVGWPSTSLVRWLSCIWITVLLRLNCVIRVVQCLLFFPGCPVGYWVWLTSMVLLFFQHTFLPTSMWRQIICLGIGCFWSGNFSLRWLRQLFAFGDFQRWTYWHLLILLNASIISPWKLHYLWRPWGWIPSAILGTFLVSYVFPPPALVPLLLSKFLAEHVNDQLRNLILVAPCWTEDPWLPTVFKYVGRCSSAVSHHKRSHHGCFGWPGTQGSAISAFNPLAAQQCVLCRQGFSSSVCQAVVGATRMSMSKVYQQCWKEWASWCAQQGLPNNAISTPKLANFLLHLFQVGLAWHTIGIYHSALSTFLGPHWIHKASNHPVIS